MYKNPPVSLTRVICKATKTRYEVLGDKWRSEDGSKKWLKPCVRTQKQRMSGKK
jgi:hypothetical protein